MAHENDRKASIDLPPMRSRASLLLRSYRWGLNNISQVRGATRLVEFLEPHVDAHPCLFPWKVFDEFKIWILSLDRNIEYCCFLRQAYGEHIAEIVRTVRGPGRVIYDVGANIGLYSLLAAAPRNANAKVYSFEPVAHTRHRLQLNIALNQLEPFIEVIGTGLSDRISEATVQLEIADSGRASVHSGLSRGIRETIQLKPLDELAAALPPPIFIKIDVEGHELAAAKGGIGVISRSRPTLLVECNLAACAAAGWDFEELLDLLRPLGYEFWRVGETRHRNEVEQDVRFPDVLCIPAVERPEVAALRELIAGDRLHAMPYSPL